MISLENEQYIQTIIYPVAVKTRKIRKICLLIYSSAFLFDDGNNSSRKGLVNTLLVVKRNIDQLTKQIKFFILLEVFRIQEQLPLLKQNF